MMFWKRFYMWLLPWKMKDCKGCCIYCKYFEECYNDIGYDLIERVEDV